jgi:bla regulator protein BlaR1
MSIHWFIQGLFLNTLAGSLFIGIILIIKRVLGYKLKAGWYYCLWLILVIRLLMPWAPESRWSIANLFHWCVGYYHTNGNQAIHSGTSDRNRDLPIVYQQSNGNEAISIRRLPIDTILFFIWCLGLFIWIPVYISYSIRTIRILQKSSPITDVRIQKLFDESRRQLGISPHANIGLMQTPSLEIPALYGLFQPVIILPDYLLNKLHREQFHHILLHELAHYRRKDIIVNLITHCLQIFYWFNPMIAYGFHQMREERESACDELVLHSLPSSDYSKYGQTVIELLQLTSSAHDIPAITPFGNQGSLKRRIFCIAVYQKSMRLERYGGMIALLLLGCIFLTNAQAVTSTPPAQVYPMGFEKVKQENLGQFFKGFDGSFILYDQEKAEYSTYHSAQNYTRLSPYSTFKIYDALIALESGVIPDPTVKLHWDGTRYPVSSWNQDQTLQSAMNYSVNWYFEKVNLKIGASKMQDYLNKINYGNNDISGGVSDFWMDSSLMISPFEQVHLLKKLYGYQLPFSRKNINYVKQIIRVAKYNQALLSGKTGTAIINNHSNYGWFVGYVEKEKNVYYFATQIQRHEGADGKKAREITLEILNAKKIIIL